MKKVFNSKEMKTEEMLENKTFQEKGNLKLIKKIALIVVVVLLIALIVLIIPKIKSFFEKDVDENIKLENQEIELKPNYEVLNDGTKVNTSEEIERSEFTLNGIKFSNIKITEKEGLTDLEIDYENTLDSDIEGFGIKLNFYNEKDEVVYYYSVSLPETIKTGEKDKIYTNILEEYAGIEDIKIEIDSEL